MGLTFIALIVTITILLLYGYLKVIYETIRKIKINLNDLNYLNDDKNNNNNNNNNYNNNNNNNSKNININNKTNLMKILLKKSINNDYIELKQAPGPLPLPVLGNLHILGQYAQPFEGFTDLAKKYGDVYSLTLGTTRCLIVNSLDSIREVLNQNGKFFGGRPDFLRYETLFGGDRSNSLALCDWSQLQQKRRNLARKHCSPRETSSYFTKMSEVGCFEMEQFMQKLAERIEPGKEFHLKTLIMQTCCNMFTQYMCSVRFDYKDEEFQTVCRYFDEIFWEINQGYAVDFLPWLLPFYRNHMNKIVNWSTTIRKFILNKIIADRENYLDMEEPEKDFTDALLRSLKQDGDVSRNTIIFMLEDFIGGHSAIGNLVMMSLANIVRNPKIGEKIQKEIDTVTGKNRKVTLLDAESLPFTVATIYEVLRDSSSPIVPHVATEDVAISGFGVTKGTLVFINNYELNKSEKYWEKPDEFDPERFVETINVTQSSRKLSESSDSGVENDSNGTDPKATKDKYPQKKEIRRIKKNIPHFLPFSIGKRTCIGQNLVKGFGFIMLANIMQTYDVTCDDINLIKTYPACVALPPDTFSLKLNLRKS